MKNTNSAAESGAFVRKTRGYSVVQNEALFNDSLSMSAKGLYALIAARIDYTAVPLTKQWLMNHCTEGERAFNRAWDMLKNNGYLVAHVRPANRGRFCYEYELRDSNNGWNGVYRQVESLTKVLAAEAKINEEMKRCNPLEWAAAMQGLQAQAEEIVCAELIYAEENTNDSLSLPGK